MTTDMNTQSNNNDVAGKRNLGVWRSEEPPVCSTTALMYWPGPGSWRCITGKKNRLCGGLNKDTRHNPEAIPEDTLPQTWPLNTGLTGY